MLFCIGYMSPLCQILCAYVQTTTPTDGCQNVQIGKDYKTKPTLGILGS